ncbi:hypothetical protein D3C71_1000030 [compost metagenome]
MDQVGRPAAQRFRLRYVGVATVSMCGLCMLVLHPWPVPTIGSDLRRGRQITAAELVHRFDPASVDVEPTGAVLMPVGCHRACKRLAGDGDRLERRLQGGSSPGAVVRLRKTAAVDPRDHVADLEASILDAHGHAVLRAGACEGQQMSTRL